MEKNKGIALTSFNKLLRCNTAILTPIKAGLAEKAYKTGKSDSFANTFGIKKLFITIYQLFKHKKVNTSIT